MKMTMVNSGLKGLILAKQITVALVSSKLDYCISLFHNIPKQDIDKIFYYNKFRNALLEC